MEQSFSIRRFGWAVAVLAGVVGVGTVVFHSVTSEGWIAAFYRSVVTTTLTGIDSRPPGAEVIRAIDGHSLGRSPVDVEVAWRKADEIFLFHLAGYREGRMVISDEYDNARSITLVARHGSTGKPEAPPDKPDPPDKPHGTDGPRVVDPFSQ